MSDIFIKEMEIPPAGIYNCKLCVFDENTAVLTIYTPFDEPQRRYKLVPVPQHGRLVDASEMFSQFIAEGQRSKRYGVGIRWELNGEEIRKVIDSLPTIIPANKEGEQ